MAISIAGRHIGPDHPPFVIAEVSGNHHGDLQRALQLVDAAADAGAHAVKFQTYRADTITLDHDGPPFRVADDHPLWGGRRLFELYEEAHTPWEWHQELFEHARARGVIPFSSPFDDSAVTLLEELAAPAFKIASLEIGDVGLLRRVAETGRPVILSNGAATVSDLALAIDCLRAAGASQIAVLACTSSYPADPAESHVRQIPVLRDMFGVEIGLSDHTRGIGAAVAAVALGASVIEKHLTLDRAEGGVDSDFSLEPHELAALVTETEIAWRALGDPTPMVTSGEAASRGLRRSLWVVEDVRQGDPVSARNVRSLRPAGGLEPAALDVAMTRVFSRDVARGTPLQWDLL